MRRAGVLTRREHAGLSIRFLLYLCVLLFVLIRYFWGLLL